MENRIRQLLTMTAIITAFNDDESVNEEKIRSEVRRQIAAGNGIFACGTNGDFSSLTFAEKIAIVEVCVDEARDRGNVIANAGCPSTYETVQLAKEFAKLGVDAVAAIIPYFISCTQEGLYRHYCKIADSLSVPLYIYNIPARTGNSIDVETVARLADHENIKGIKDSSGKTECLDALASIASENKSFDFFSGTDSLILYGFRHGAEGCVSGLANIVPDWIRSVADAFENGNQNEADLVQGKITEFRKALYAQGYPPAMVKRTLYLLDKEVGNSRMPSLIPSPKIDATLNLIIEEFGIRHRYYA